MQPNSTPQAPRCARCTKRPPVRRTLLRVVMLAAACMQLQLAQALLPARPLAGLRQRHCGNCVSARRAAARGHGGNNLSMLDVDFFTMPQREFNFYVGFMALAFQGIFPYTVQANKSLLDDMGGLKKLPAVTSGDETTLSNQGQLLYAEPVCLLDVVNVVSRFSSYEELQAEVREDGTKSNYVTRSAFKAQIRRLQPKSWPLDANGLPVGQGALSTTSVAALKKRELPESALNVVFDALSGSSRAELADRIKVNFNLQAWRPDAANFNVRTFEQELAGVRAAQISVYGGLIAIQLACWSVFFINPVLQRYVFKSNHWELF